MRLSLVPAFAALTLVASSPAMAQPATVDLRILAINDFHGYLRPSPGIRISDPADRQKKMLVPARKMNAGAQK